MLDMPEIPSPEKIVSEFMVLVEGRDEKTLFLHLLKYTHHKKGIQIIDSGGKSQIKGNIDMVMKRAEIDGVSLTSLAIVRDADEHPKRALQSVQGSLKNIEGLTLKKAPAHATFATGLYKGNRMKFGIFVMPDGRSKGCLETLCWRFHRG